MPQIAIEIMVSNPLLDKLDVYAGLGVAEVWVWHSPSHAFSLHHFVRAGESHTALAKQYRAALRAAV